MDINQRIFDSIVEHMTDVRLYEEGVQLQNRRILKRHRENLSKLLNKNIRSDVTPEVRRFNKELSSHVISSIKEFSTSQLSFHSDNFYKETKKFYKTQRPRTKELLEEITGPNIKGEKTIPKNLANISSGELVRIQTKVRAGLANGTPPKEIIRSVLKTTKLTEAQAKTLTRTSITSTQSAALTKVVENNKEIVKGYLFSAILDSRTSPICSYHNGKIYDVNDTRFKPPLHWNCRSTLIPVIKSKEELKQVATNNITVFGESHTKENVKVVEKRIEDYKPKFVYHEFYEDPKTITWAKKNGFILRKGDLSYKEKDALIKKYGGATEQFHRDRESFMIKQINEADKTVKNAFLMGNDHAFNTKSVIWQDKTIRKIDYKGKIYNPKTNIDKKALESVSETLLSGLLAKIQSFGDWLKNQPYSVQSKILGSDEKANLFRGGKLKARQYVTPQGTALSIQALRRKAAELTSVFKPKQKLREADVQIKVNRPSSLISNPKNKYDLITMFLLDSDDYSKTFSLTDFKGTTLAGKTASRRRTGNVFDERNFSADPLTGEIKNTLIYDPDFNLFQERLDFMRSSKLLSSDEKDFIESTVLALDDKISVNQQTVIVENLRVVFERYAKDKKPWDDFAAVVRAENRFSVQNVSRLLDTRSRRKSELFLSYMNMKDDVPKVQIMGKYYDFDDLQKNLLKDQRFIDNWRATEGSKLAKKIYFTGRAPLKAYFKRLTDSYPDDKDFSNFLMRQINRITTEDPRTRIVFRPLIRAWQIWNKSGKPTESFWEANRRLVREQYRRIIDLEFLFSKRKPTSRLMDDKSLDTITKAVKLIASGQSTDYDALAINIGKSFNEDFKDILPFTSHTLKDHHTIGSEILDYLKDQNIIRVQFRGKTRRGVIDLETGRASGGWADTISREVIVIDKSVLRLQEAERRVTIARRLGTVEPRDRLYVRPGEKVFFDARGNRTGIPIISRDKFPDYDANQIDRDIANMMNHVSNVEYSVDNEFFDFMDDLLRFRDPRGNAKYWDSLNKFRQEILSRGEQGYGLMSTAKWHRLRGENFKTQVFIDSRGRVYHRGYLTPTGGEIARPFLNSGRSVAITPEAVDELKIQIGAMIGSGTETLTQAGRRDIFKRNEEKILEIGSLLQSKTQRDRRIREFLQHPLVEKEKGKEVPKLARLALEYKRIYDHVDGDFTNNTLLKKYKTKLMIENDASSSGAQIIALSTGDRQIAKVSNVVATSQKNRLYDLVAMDTVNDPEFNKIASLRDANLTWEDLAKAAKSQNMVSFYGAGAATKTANVASELASILRERDFLVITKDDLSKQLSIVDGQIKLAKRLNADATEQTLLAFRKELVELVNSNQPAGRAILKQAYDIHPDTAEFVETLTNARAKIVSPKDFSEINRIMSKNLAERAPVTDEFITYWKRVAKIYVNETQKVDIPWVTFDGKIMTQRYRPKIQERIEFTDPVTGRKIANIYEDSAENGKLLGKSSVNDASIGLGVNGNHSNDAVIVRQFHLWGRKNNVDTGTIHDAFFTNIGDAQKAKDALRTIYADALEGDTIRKTLKQMRKEGLSYSSYRKLLKEAKDLGLIDPKDKLTRADILAPFKEGEDWYGIGP